jgi:hypothetical protein
MFVSPRQVDIIPTTTATLATTTTTTTTTTISLLLLGQVCILISGEQAVLMSQNLQEARIYLYPSLLLLGTEYNIAVYGVENGTGFDLESEFQKRVIRRIVRKKEEKMVC